MKFAIRPHWKISFSQLTRGQLLVRSSPSGLGVAQENSGMQEVTPMTQQSSLTSESALNHCQRPGPIQCGGVRLWAWAPRTKEVLRKEGVMPERSSQNEASAPDLAPGAAVQSHIPPTVSIPFIVFLREVGWKPISPSVVILITRAFLHYAEIGFPITSACWRCTF